MLDWRTVLVVQYYLRCHLNYSLFILMVMLAFGATVLRVLGVFGVLRVL